jgi:uncharacterized membrane protein YedE/YeeE
MNGLRRKSWSPYAVGAGIGVLSWFAFAMANHPIGITSAFENTAALGAKAAAPGMAQEHAYFTSPENKPPKIGWEWMLVLGVFFGSLASALLSKDRELIRVPRLWASRFGNSTALRMTAALGGGALMMFGARLAKGCTSGHAISGTLQLAVSSWLFAALIFAVAIGTAFVLYGREGARRV